MDVQYYWVKPDLYLQDLSKLKSDEFTVSSITDTNDTSVENMGGDNACPYCSANFETRGGFLQHIMLDHTDEVTLEPPPNEPSLSIRNLHNYVFGQMSDPQPESVNYLRQLRVSVLPMIFNESRKFFTVLDSYVHAKNNRFKLYGRTWRVVLSSLGKEAAKIGCTLALIDAILSCLLTQIKKLHKSESPFYISFSISQPQILDPPITTPYLSVDKLNTHAQFLAQIQMVGMSKSALLVDEEFSVEFNILGLETEVNKLSSTFGSQPSRNQFPTDSDFAKSKKKSVINVPNVLYPNDCLLVAVVLGIQILSATNFKKLFESKMFRDPKNSKKLKSLVINFNNSFGKEINWNVPQTLSACLIIQSYLNSDFKYQLIVHSNVRNHNDIFFRGKPSRRKPSQIHLLLLNHHIYLLKNYERFYALETCKKCLRTFKKGKHKTCRGVGRFCLKCRTTSCYNVSRGPNSNMEHTAKMCLNCYGYFPTQYCFDQHKGGVINPTFKTPTCSFFFHCKTCGLRLEKLDPMSNDLTPSKAHKCLQLKCKSCYLNYDYSEGKRHFCIISKPGIKELGISKKWLSEQGGEINVSNILETMYSSIVGEKGIVCFDIETRVSQNTGKLCPFALTAFFSCSKCCYINFKLPSEYQDEYGCCGKRFREYIGSDGIKEFILD